MRNIVALEEGLQDSACAKRIGFESDEEEDWWREWMMGSDEMLVQVRDQVSREVHSATLELSRVV